MKIAVFVYEYPPKIVGGLGTYAAEITRKFVLMDHDVTVFTMNDDAGTLPTREIWRGIEIHRPLHIDISDSLPDVIAEDIRKWGRGIHLFGKLMVYNYLSAAKLVNELIKKEGMKYDIVIAHDWLSVMGGITVKRESGLPLGFSRALNGTGQNNGKRQQRRKQYRVARRKHGRHGCHSFLCHERRTCSTRVPQRKNSRQLQRR